eukprot:SAG11_NODE_36554_length_261_cov_0.617284_1_plen_59_part_01
MWKSYFYAHMSMDAICALCRKPRDKLRCMVYRTVFEILHTRGNALKRSSLRYTETCTHP